MTTTPADININIDTARRLSDHAAQLERENARLRRALEFYAAPAHWDGKHRCLVTPAVLDAAMTHFYDTGQHARLALGLPVAGKE